MLNRLLVRWSVYIFIEMESTLITRTYSWQFCRSQRWDFALEFAWGTCLNCREGLSCAETYHRANVRVHSLPTCDALSHIDSRCGMSLKFLRCQCPECVWWCQNIGFAGRSSWQNKVLLLVWFGHIRLQTLLPVVFTEIYVLLLIRALVLHNVDKLHEFSDTLIFRLPSFTCLSNQRNRFDWASKH